MKKQKISVVTSSRAEYSLIYWILKGLKSDKDFQLQLIATGGHLSSDFGNTIDLIRNDGFKITEEVDMLLPGDDLSAMSKSTGVGIIKFTDVFFILKPDLLLVLGDRFEIFSAVYAARLLRIPIIHISGGDTSEGAIDNELRHSISLMSSLHFPKIQKHKKKLLNLGVSNKDIIVTGYLGLENVAKLKLLSKCEIENRIKVQIKSPLALITFHPVTKPIHNYDNNINVLLKTLSVFPDLQCIFTSANADSCGRQINTELMNYCKKNPKQNVFIKNLGREFYPSLMAQCDLLIGNSSSGILESGYFKVPVVNIQPRQNGRDRNCNVVDCENKVDNLIKAIEVASSKPFRRKCKTIKNIFEIMPPLSISKKIIETIKMRF
jgi:GDP/UDP-N,N'-diacetylbacillosamine 2-epimerase (hydrolysing)